MSAWIVSKDHIDLLVSEGLRRRITCILDQNVHPFREVFLTEDNRDEFGQMLWDENRESVDFRYQEHTEPDTYTFEWVNRVPSRVLMNAIHSYEYQSCEHNDWKTSASCYFVTQLMDDLLRECVTGPDLGWSFSRDDLKALT